MKRLQESVIAITDFDDLISGLLEAEPQHLKGVGIVTNKQNLRRLPCIGPGKPLFK